MSTVRWGLVSTANINRRLIPAIRESKRGKLTAVASRSQSSAETYAASWNIPNAFGSYEAMLQSDIVDAVYISLPNHLHAEWTVKALRGGKHVLCEKPFALTLDEVDAMIAAQAETGKVLAEAFMYRHYQQTKITGELVRNGRIGDVRLVRGTFNFAIRSGENIRLVPEYGGGSLWDVGVYPVSFAQFIIGSAPSSVTAYQFVGSSGVEVSFAGQMVYPNGAAAQISSSLQSPFYTMTEVIGTEGRLHLTRPFTNLDDSTRRLMLYPREGKPEEIDVPDEFLYLAEVEDMHDAILEAKAPYLSLNETRDHVRTVLALYEAAKTGTAVTL